MIGVIVALLSLAGAVILAYRRDTTPENPPEMTELEREVVVPRVKELEDDELSSIDELIEALDDLDDDES